MNAQSSLLLKVQCIRLLTKECLQSSAEADSIINYTHVIPTDKSVGYYHSSAAPTFEPKPFVIHKHYVSTALFSRQTPSRAGESSILSIWERAGVRAWARASSQEPLPSRL